MKSHSPKEMAIAVFLLVIALIAPMTLTGCGHHYDNLVAPPVDNGGGGCTTNCNPPPHDSTGGGNTKYTGSVVRLIGPLADEGCDGIYYLPGTTCGLNPADPSVAWYPGGVYSTWDSTKVLQGTILTENGFTFVKFHFPKNTWDHRVNLLGVVGNASEPNCYGIIVQTAPEYSAIGPSYNSAIGSHTTHPAAGDGGGCTTCNPPPAFTFPFTNTLTPNASTTMTAHNPIVGGLKDGVTTVWVWSKMDKDWIWWVTGSAPANFSASTAAPCMGNLLNGVTADPMGTTTNQPDVYEYKLPTWLRGVIVRTNEPVRWKTDPTGDALGFAYIQQSIHTVGGGSNGYRWYIAPDGKPLPASMAPAGTPVIDAKNGLFAADVLHLTIN